MSEIVKEAASKTSTMKSTSKTEQTTKTKKTQALRTRTAAANQEQRLLNRELSWLTFNERVLAEANDPRNPLLERLKYTAICGSNLDEFFMVRVAGIDRQIAAGVQTPSADGLLPREALQLMRSRTQEMMSEVEDATNNVFKALEEQGVKIDRVSDLSKKAREALHKHYLSEIQPVLTPLIVDPGHPFPYLSNLSLNLAVILSDGPDEEKDFARVKIPVSIMPRVIEIDNHLLMLEDVIASNIQSLFKGRKVVSTYLFRVTRNTDWEFVEDEAEDLLATIEDGLRRRRFGSAVRLEMEKDSPERLVSYLQEKLQLDSEDVYLLEGPLGTSDLMGLPIERPDLSFPDFRPAVVNLDGIETGSIFETLRHGDVVMHHPYDSFANVLRFVEEASEDPSVLAIKQTLYRTGDDPRLLGALRRAAESGKQVVAMIELKARFDEQRNISWAKQLEQAGVHVVYGIPGLKTHAKVILVVRREPTGLRRYVHMGTGNYNAKTARLYTDISVLSADRELGADATELFNHLTGYAEAEYSQLLVAPDTARSGFEELIEREIEHAQAGKEAWIRAKCNQLTDPPMINALYAASQAGVRVDLLIRGMCSLRPRTPNLSENIRVRSLLGRYLEHARVFAFGNAGQPEVYFGSADWMTRNLDRRVEVMAPVLEDRHRETFLNILDAEWNDERGSWELLSTGEYEKIAGELSAQNIFSGSRHSIQLGE